MEIKLKSPLPHCGFGKSQTRNGIQWDFKLTTLSEKELLKIKEKVAVCEAEDVVFSLDNTPNILFLIIIIHKNLDFWELYLNDNKVFNGKRNFTTT